MTPDQLKASILQHAMEGKLVPQDPSDQPASELLAEIQQEKAQLIKEKKIKKTKPLPAISEDEIPFEIPDSWEWVRLGDVTRILMGQAPKGDTVSSNKENGIEFHQGKTFFGPKVIQRSDKYTSQDNKIIDAGTIVMAVRAPVGNVNLCDRKIYIGRGLAGIKPLKSGVNLLYLYNYLLTRKTHFESQATGSTFKAINGKIIENEVVPLPPLAEQKRIVDKLDRIMPLIDEYAKSYTHLAEIDGSFNNRMKKSILQYAMEGKLVPQDPSDQPASELLAEIQQEKAQLVKEKKIKRTKPLPEISEDEIPFEIPDSWEWVRLGNYADIVRGGSPRPIKAYITEDPDGINWIKIGDTSPNSKYITRTAEKIIPDGLKKTRMVHRGDFILSNSMSFGRPYILKIDGAIHDGWLALSNFKGVFLEDYLYNLLKSEVVRKQFVTSAKGLTVKNLNKERVGNIIVPLPPLAEQKRIVDKIDKMFEILN